jgi:hypothetical protein
MRFFVALGLIFVTEAQAVQTQATESSGMESLGRELLDDLAPDVLRQPAAPPRDPASPTPRFDDLGEDIGQPFGLLSLARVRHAMQQAESLLAQQDAAATATDTLQQARSVQQEVVNQLDKLIAELSKQCQGGQCEPSDQPPKPQRSQTKPGKSSSAAGRGQTAARDSNARLDQTSAQSIDKADLDALVKDLWGHLPERSREQMLQSFSDEFLPKYELEIEQYYRRLSEDAEERH